VFGGFVEMELEGHATQIAKPSAWNVRMVIALTSEGAKATSSTDGMTKTTETSPYYAAWIQSHDADLDRARDAVEARDLTALGEVAEASCLKMHAAAMAAEPGVIYWNGVTVDLIHRVRALRDAGTPCWFTIDAGPHVKVLCQAAHADAIARELVAVPGVVRTLVAPPGEGVEILSEKPGAGGV
jgi:diphosphomevalonate decarboxylase